MNYFFLLCFFFFGWLKISIWFEYVNQKNKLEEDLEEVTIKVFFDIKIGEKHMGMAFVGLCLTICCALFSSTDLEFGIIFTCEQIICVSQ
jgi:hypothetical protein